MTSQPDGLENSFIEELQRYRSNYVFRGVADARWDLQTFLMRLGAAYALLENSILRSFRKYAHRDSAGGESVWNWLTLAQHHGLPTRLLDWTYSPYVAMHFATAEIRNMGVDGAIWCVDFTKVKEHFVTLVARKGQIAWFHAQGLMDVAANKAKR